MVDTPPSGPRNLILCCDGTGNEVGVHLSNVLKLYRIATKDEGQLVFYHPGVGTIGQPRAWLRAKQKVKEVVGLATGYGLDDNILEAYAFLCRTYRDGDRIFLFGFSRGAYTVRALAGLICLLGLLRPEQLNLCGYALVAYKRASSEDDLSIAWDFERVIGGRTVPIHFVGVWDTVASVLVPRPDRFYLPSMEFLPYTMRNPRVRAFRQAIAIDERRRMFRLYGWRSGQEFRPNRYGRASAVPQDEKQVWFAGVHADVGGGYPEADSGLSKFPLLWMLEEAERQGLRLNPAMLKHLGRGAGHRNGKHVYVAPNAAGKLHNSLKGAWHVLEWLPKKIKWRRWPEKGAGRGWYLPRGEPRKISEGARVHQSVIDRMAIDPTYRPINLPPAYRVEPEA